MLRLSSSFILELSHSAWLSEMGNQGKGRNMELMNPGWREKERWDVGTWWWEERCEEFREAEGKMRRILAGMEGKRLGNCEGGKIGT